MYEQQQPSLLNLLGTVVVFVILAGYGIVSLSTEDPMWFVTSFSEQAAQVTVYCRGQATVLDSGSPHLAPLNTLFNEALSGTKNWDSLTMSDETYAYYQTSDAVVALEYAYNVPVRVHSIYKYFSGIDTMVVPLIGRHSAQMSVFAQIDGVPTAGALHVQSNAPLMSYLADNGLCSP